MYYYIPLVYYLLDYSNYLDSFKILDIPKNVLLSRYCIVNS